MLQIALLMAAAALGTGENDGKTMALDDWQSMSILEVGSTAPGGPRYLRVAAGDLDGDGRADEAYVRLVCADGSVSQASYSIVSPRDAASGLPTGKRQHKPMTIVKEWGAATPELRAMKVGYDIKMAKGARMTADSGGWTSLRLTNTDGLCAASEQAAAIVKAKSNITNN